MSEEEKEELKSLIEEYEICYKESKYEGNVEDYKELKGTHKLLNNVLNYIEKLQKENEESKELYNKLLIGYNKLVQEYLELEKVIDLMATELSRRPLMIYLDNERDDRLVILDNPKEIIKYYTKKAEEEK